MVNRVRGLWHVDIGYLEALLGLWIWSLKNERVYLYHVSWLLKEKIFSTSQGFLAVDAKARRQAEIQIELWILREKRENHLWIALPGEERIWRSENQGANSFSPFSLPLTSRFLSYTDCILYRDLNNMDKINLLSVRTQNSLLTMATQDIFTSFIDALASCTDQLEGVNIVQSLRNDASANETIATSHTQPFLGLSHNHTDRLVDLFVQAELGSREDALLSIIPSFNSRSLLPSLLDNSEKLKSEARRLAREQRWGEAEILLVALFDEARKKEGKQKKAKNKQKMTRFRAGYSYSQSEALLRELGACYRMAIRCTAPSNRDFGYRGVYNMWKMRSDDETERLDDIRQNYIWFALQLARLRSRCLGPHDARAPAWLRDIPEDIQYELPRMRKKNFNLSLTKMTLQDVIQSQSAYPTGLIVADRFKDQIKAGETTEPPLLVWAAQKGCMELAEDLIEAGLNIDGLDGDRRTPLSHACENGDVHVAKLLLDADAALIPDKDNQMPFFWAAEEGFAHVVELFVGMKFKLDYPAKYERTALWQAAENGHEAVVKLLLEPGRVDPNALGGRERESPLSASARNGHDAVVLLLLKDDKVKVKVRDRKGKSALMHAASNGRNEIIKMLLDVGNADVEVRSDSRKTALMWAAINGHAETVKLLMEVGKAKLEVKDAAGKTALISAAEKGYKDEVAVLLKEGDADVESEDLEGRTSLSWAAQQGHKEAVELLLKEGKANIESKAKNGRTALSWAESEGGAAEDSEVYVVVPCLLLFDATYCKIESLKEFLPKAVGVTEGKFYSEGRSLSPCLPTPSFSRECSLASTESSPPTPANAASTTQMVWKAFS